MRKTFAFLLVFALIAPSVFFIRPQTASAQLSGAIQCLAGSALGLAETAVSSLLAVPTADAVTQMQTTVTASVTTQDCIYNTVIMPLARLLARIVLQQITANIIGWITGQNVTGQSMFVTNLPGHLQRLGDTVVSSFLIQFARNINSPFASAIGSSLRINYLQSTSLAGFFAANQSTLYRYSPNVSAFLSGNWSQGGIPAWFALTTQPQNNPYLLYQRAESQLASAVASAVSDRTKQLDWGSGFLSICVPQESTGEIPAGQTTFGDDYGAGYEATYNAENGIGGVVGDSCYKNGVPGKIQTPSSIISGYAKKAVVDSGIEQLISAQDLDSALGAIVTALIGQVLSDSGLFGASESYSGRPALTTQLRGYAGNNQTSASSATSLAQATLSRVNAYVAAWNTITLNANTASSSIVSLINFCTNAALTNPVNSTFASRALGQAAIAQNVLTTDIALVLTQSRTAITAARETEAFAFKVQAEATNSSSVTSSTTAEAIALAADTATLATLPPTVANLVSVQENTQTTGAARANPLGSLSVSGGTIVDRMRLLSTNAEGLKTSVCTENESDSGPVDPGGI